MMLNFNYNEHHLSCNPKIHVVLLTFFITSKILKFKSKTKTQLIFSGANPGLAFTYQYYSIYASWKAVFSTFLVASFRD